MALPSRYWADLTTTDFAALDPASTVAVLPLGATEQHGPHLPLAVDHCLVDGIVQRALPLLSGQLPVLVLPTQQVGYSPEHADFPGTLTLPIDTVIATWVALGECVARAGVRKLLLFNAHGGQVSVMDIVARELRMRCGLIVYGASWWNLPLGDDVNGLFPPEEHRFGVHGGDMETSLMLALAADRVRMAQAGDFPSTSRDRAAKYAILGNGRSAKLGWAMQDYNAQGAAGNAAAGSAEKGRAVLDAAARQLALLLQEVAQLPLSTVVKRS
ncbi:creatininase family protein [Ramlibacter sp. USB13]|uniref:Creatininase family protein n=1 Tax=Ramlibacter cellulosilyticus TaxID=2764187 RepID=A0A923SBL2_9BURK|nr:creatininase family protein [Ramlibacter cellulosilyticus]MBC5783985.1 creatininase family protein [Ramlibacter cellulosilyticus]